MDITSQPISMSRSRQPRLYADYQVSYHNVIKFKPEKLQIYDINY